MKKAILLATLALASLHSSAQKQWVNLTLSDYYGADLRNNDDQNGTSRLRSAGINILPSIGYNRFLGEHWGLGLELGYRRFYFRREDYSKDLAGNENTGSITQRMQAWYVCPSIFENYSWKQFRGIASISIPIERRTDISQEYYGKNVNINPGQTGGEGLTITKQPNELAIGIFANIGIQRKIVGGLYFGPQIEFGLANVKSKGEYSRTTINTPTGGSSQQVSDQNQVNTLSSRFTFEPSVSLCYYF